ncbi:MAG: LLM class flavin-dependent oxidoreductase [Candidatus Tectomicrobia bacterium]|nr:LLM class flavin-dependent oxidoreductase [Candidatus Tectomicrobia bacterium]
MERLGVALAPQQGIDMAHYIRMAQLAERQGYETLWGAESNGYELFSFLGVILSQTSRIKVAPGIASIFTRTPAFMTMSAASWHAIAPHRTLLGLGVSTRIIVGNWHGLTWDHPLARTAEYVEMLRQGLRGERLMHAGDHYHAQHFRLSVEPPGDVPIYLAAVNPKMLRLAGAIADGVLLTWVPLESVPAVIAEIRTGAAEAGREPQEVDIAMYLRTCVTDDRSPAMEWLRRDITGYAVADVYRRVLRRFGFKAEVDAMQEAWKRGERNQAMQYIADPMVDALGLIGSADECRAKVDAFVAAGVDMPIILPFTPEAEAAPAYERTIAAFRSSSSG